MMSDLNELLTRPAHVIQSLYDAHAASSSAADLEAFVGVVREHFTRALTSTGDALSGVRTLDAHSKAGHLPADGTLVRFRAMVQDTSLGNEIFQGVSASASSSKAQVLLYGIEPESSEESTAITGESNEGLAERNCVYLVSVPGEQAWAPKGSADDVQEQVGKLSLKDGDDAEASTASKYMALKHPAARAGPHFALVGKLYGSDADAYKPCDVREFVGLVGKTTLSSAFDDESASVLPALHVICALPDPVTQPRPSALSSDQVASARTKAHAYFTSALQGDSDAAEWLLLSLVSRVHARHSSALALGAISLNLALPTDLAASRRDTLATELKTALESLRPRVRQLMLSIDALNDEKTLFAPKVVESGGNGDETLAGGLLQVADGTCVLVDALSLGEGQLTAHGVRNLERLGTAMRTRKLAYDFPFVSSPFEIDQDAKFVILSEGASLVKADAIVHVKPSEQAPVARPTEDELTLLRDYFAQVCAPPRDGISFDITESISKYVQDDFVRIRKDATQRGLKPDEVLTQDDLLSRLTLARVLAVSRGMATLDEQTWDDATELDERRKERVPPRKRTAA